LRSSAKASRQHGSCARRSRVTTSMRKGANGSDVETPDAEFVAHAD
jgi:hypothetical protein